MNGNKSCIVLYCFVSLPTNCDNVHRTWAGQLRIVSIRSLLKQDWENWSNLKLSRFCFSHCHFHLFLGPGEMVRESKKKFNFFFNEPLASLHYSWSRTPMINGSRFFICTAFSEEEEREKSGEIENFSREEIDENLFDFFFAEENDCFFPSLLNGKKSFKL